ncbi:hypothetical protein CK203_028813 [Vitis vinifera]|uniref:Reverse transcriptase zinc-binding domain-containing protein n=1 Tax=Vitis vinifera TaxID=29760 RepID=A0A438IA16_VITVI|nr:hypothetical protein CK203_028813 [Vitis vinifera]
MFGVGDIYDTQTERGEQEGKWEESGLAKFSQFLGFHTEGLEKEILNFLTKIRKRREKIHKRLGTGQRAPDCDCPMKMKILSWNETKIQAMSDSIARSICSGRFLDWKAVNAEGVSGGILICWDRRSLDILDWEEGQFTLSCRFRNVENGAIWIFTGVYGLFSKVERDALWDESSQRRMNSAMRKFAEIVDDLGLMDLPLQGGEFTWNGGQNNQAWARLDRFLVSPSWTDNSMGLISVGCPVRYPITSQLLGGKELRLGGSASYKLATKMKEIKQKLKVWNREVFGKLESNKSLALQQVEFWDREESERILTVEETELKKEAKDNYRKWVIMEETHWRQLSREIWLKEGDRNTGFFHRMTSAHQDMGWKADIGSLQFDQISLQEAENLRGPLQRMKSMWL